MQTKREVAPPVCKATDTHCASEQSMCMWWVMNKIRTAATICMCMSRNVLRLAQNLASCVPVFFGGGLVSKPIKAKPNHWRTVSTVALCPVHPPLISDVCVLKSASTPRLMLSRLRHTRRGRAGGGRKWRLCRAKRRRSCELRWAKTRRENSKKGKQGDSSLPRTLHYYSQLHPQLSSAASPFCPI